MNRTRAINLYHHMVNEKRPRAEIETVLRRLNVQHGINLFEYDEAYRRTIGYTNNRFDINTYGKSGSRTMSQSRGQMGSKI